MHPTDKLSDPSLLSARRSSEAWNQVIVGNTLKKAWLGDVLRELLRVDLCDLRIKPGATTFDCYMEVCLQRWEDRGAHRHLLLSE